MMDMICAYKISSFEMRLLTMKYSPSDYVRLELEGVTSAQFSEAYEEFLGLSHGFVECSENTADGVQVCVSNR